MWWSCSVDFLVFRLLKAHLAQKHSLYLQGGSTAIQAVVHVLSSPVTWICCCVGVCGCLIADVIFLILFASNKNAPFCLGVTIPVKTSKMNIFTDLLPLKCSLAPNWMTWLCVHVCDRMIFSTETPEVVCQFHNSLLLWRCLIYSEISRNLSVCVSRLWHCLLIVCKKWTPCHVITDLVIKVTVLE